MSDKIASVRAREVLDSRGNPTVAVDGHAGRRRRRLGDRALRRVHRHPRGAGAARRRPEALRRQGRAQGRRQRQRQDRAGASRACPRTTSARWTRRCSTWTARRTRRSLGANAILGVSLAAAHAAAAHAGVPLYRYLGGEDATLLPLPLLNILNGGRHAEGSTDFQEFMVAPVGAPTFAEALRWARRGLPRPAKILHDEGPADDAWATRAASRRRCRRNDAAMRADRRSAIETAGYRPGERRRHRARPGDLRARGGRQVRPGPRGPHALARGDGRPLGGLVRAATRSSRSRTGWRRRTGTAGARSPRASGDRVQLVGDDIFVTNAERIREGIRQEAANSVLIKVNQIGTLTRDAGRDRGGPARRLDVRDVAPQRRDRGHDDRRPGGGHRRRPDQDRRPRPRRAHGEVQPPAARSRRSWAAGRGTRAAKRW